jgi:hypothetical protein
MLIKCQNCDVGDNIKKEGNALLCKSCGEVVKPNFSEVDGVVLMEDSFNYSLPKNSYLLVYNSTEDIENSLRVLVSQNLPTCPYDGCKPIKGYRFTGNIKIEAYYE